MQTEDWLVFGFENIKKILEKQLVSGHFAHAYLFTGTKSLGKRTLALEFAKKILGTKKLDNHPDFQMLDIEGEIGVEQVRSFASTLNFKPFLGSYKVAIINNAQNITVQGVNGLLKTLEEPSASTILILISQTRKLLPTLLSRCQVFNFNPLTQAQVQNYAQAHNLKIDSELITLSLGSVGRLNRIAEDEEWGKQQEENLSELETLRKSALGERLVKINELADLEDGALSEKLSLWLKAASRKLTAPGMLKTANVLSRAMGEMRTNKNRKLILQGLFLNL